MLGVYSETVYEIVPLPDGEIRTFSVQYHDRNHSTIRQLPGRHTIASSSVGIYQVGEIHALEAGDWHETTVPNRVLKFG